MRLWFGPCLLALAAPIALGCAGSEKVVRVIDGRPVAGEFVPSEAYAAYLRGFIADAAGDLDGAVEGYAIATALGPRDPEPFARLGDVRCRKDPRDARAEEAIGRALSIDVSYEPALEARASCAERRGDVRVAQEAARRAMKADPSAIGPLATLARIEPREREIAGAPVIPARGPREREIAGAPVIPARGPREREIAGAPVIPARGPREREVSYAASEDLRARLIAMTLVSGTNVAAWNALAAWARGHGDALLEARALSHASALVGSMQVEVDSAIARLEGEGEIVAARMLARARVESSALGPIDPQIARLAIDDALLSGDSSAAHLVAMRSRIPAVVLAARELLNGDESGARAVASMLSAAEPRAIAPRLLLSVLAEDRRGGTLAVHLHPAVPLSGAPIPPEVWLAYARSIARAGTSEGARAVLQAIPREPVIAEDSLASPIAVALAARGVLEPTDLDPNGRIELAERRSEPAPDDVIAAADARHRLLALARRAPHDSRTIALARTLLSARGRDPVVAVAFARLALAGAVDSPAMGDLLARLDPSDPLVASAALDWALRGGDTKVIPLARARLAAVARTPAERARVVE